MGVGLFKITSSATNPIAGQSRSNRSPSNPNRGTFFEHISSKNKGKKKGNTRVTELDNCSSWGWFQSSSNRDPIALQSRIGSYVFPFCCQMKLYKQKGIGDCTVFHASAVTYLDCC